MSDAWRATFFREARPAGRGWNLAKTASQLVIFWGVFLILVPQALVALERRMGIAPFGPVSRPLFWILFVLASALGVGSAVIMALHGAGTPLPMDGARRLVVRGPYRHVRNPMALAGLTQGACVAGLHGSWLTLAMVAAGFLVWNYGVRPLEEQHLTAQFGDAYGAYRSAVRCWIPRLRGYRGNWGQSRIS